MYLARELKKSRKHKHVCEIENSWCAWNDPHWLYKGGMEVLEIEGRADIIKLQQYYDWPEYLEESGRLNKTLVENPQLTLVWTTKLERI